MCPRFLIACLLGATCLPGLRAQCPLPVPDTLAWETFEAGLPADWDAPPASQGAAWQVDSGTIGYYENPGQGQWLYIDDEAQNDVGAAAFTTASYDLSGYAEGISLHFLLNFQEFADSGQMYLDVRHQGTWRVLMVQAVDFKGRISLDLSDLAPGPVQFRFRYEDEGAWTWGMGIDDFLLTALPNPCGNGICDPGEAHATCPGDCPALPVPAPTWVAPGYDVAGQPVAYRWFKGGTACDDCSEVLDLGFAFDFFGQPYEQVHLNANGNLTFEAPFTAYLPAPFCLAGPRMIAPFYADVDLSQGGDIRYYQDPAGHYLIVTWMETGYFGCGRDCPLRNSFQVVLTDGSLRQIGTQVLPFGTTVVFSYGEMTWTTGNSSGGVAGFGGMAATVGLNLGDGVVCYDYGTFDQPGYAYYGNSQDDQCPPNRVQHLSHRWLAFDGGIGQPVWAGEQLLLTASATETGHAVSWETDQPEAAGTYTLFRSGDGDTYQPLATFGPDDHLPGLPGHYAYLDAAPPPGMAYYRLVFQPAGGDETASAVAAVSPGDDSAPAAGSLHLEAVGPNPFGDYLDITYRSEADMTAQYVLADMSGRVLVQGEVAATDRPQPLRIQTARLPAGMYVLTFFYPGGLTHRRLLKR